MPTHSTPRASRRPVAWLAGLLLAAGFAGVPPHAQADPACGPPAQRLYAVDAHSGHLAELELCADRGGFLPATDVDGGDWRAYRDVFAAADGAATVVYAVTQDGQLWWRRQETPGAPLGAPVRVGDADWSPSGEVLASRPGVIHTVPPHDGSVATFEHQDWASGGGTVVPDEPLFWRFRGPAITAVHDGSFAEDSEPGVGTTSASGMATSCTRCGTSAARCRPGWPRWSAPSRPCTG